MKLNGEKLETHNVETIIIPRGNGKDIVLKAAAIMDNEEFDRLCPEPIAPRMQAPGKISVPDYNDHNYKLGVKQRNEMKVAWTVIKSLQATEDLVWETVNINDANSWMNYEKELKDSGFSPIEIHRIFNGVMAANCLNQEKLDAARERFFLIQEAQRAIAQFPMDEQLSMQSGELAKDSG